MQPKNFQYIGVSLIHCFSKTIEEYKPYKYNIQIVKDIIKNKQNIPPTIHNTNTEYIYIIHIDNKNILNAL